MMAAALEPARLGRWSLLTGVLALVASLLAAVLYPLTALQSWYAATLFWSAIPLGALALLLLHQLTAGRWGWYIRPLLLAAIATLPLMLLAYLPLLLSMELLFPWTQPVAQLPDVVQKKLAYLNIPFFIIRSLAYFAIWLALATAAGAWRHDGGTQSSGLAAGGLILYGLSITFFGVDWVQSLDPEFYSSTIGYRMATGQFVAILAFAIAAAAALGLRWGERQPPWLDLGNLLLAAVMLWIYIVLMKYVVIWSGDVVNEIRWYLHREQGVWYWLTLLLVLLHFCLPFVALLFRPVKLSPRWLGLLAAVLLAAHALDVSWLVLPSFPNRPAYAGLLDVLVLIGLGGFWLAAFLWCLQRTDWRSREVADD
jgi:hypothetical protein